MVPSVWMTTKVNYSISQRQAGSQLSLVPYNGLKILKSGIFCSYCLADNQGKDTMIKVQARSVKTVEAVSMAEKSESMRSDVVSFPATDFVL